jgi:hypothetical protein
VLWERWNQWTLTDLPRLNRLILSGSAPPQSLAAQFNRSVLADLPVPESLSPEDARRVLVFLGLGGASVARHHQEANPSRKARPGESFHQLRAGPARMPFLAYFSRLAATTKTGHVGRDCYASLVRWNAPTTVVDVEGDVVARLPGSFPDTKIRTYTDAPGEVAFFELLKKSEALELAVNDTLEPVAEGSIDIRSPEAGERALRATRLMDALIRCNQAFAAVPAERGGLRTEHFLDVFRQFAVHWELGDVPPSGAQDPEFLRRDFLLGINFPGYAKHVEQVYPALLSDERAMLERLSTRPALPELLLESLGLDVCALAASTSRQLRATVREHPGLAAWYLLLAANAKFGAVHLMLTEKYLFKPQRDRDRSGIGDRALVSNRRGTTGMEEPLLVRLTQARRDHPLRCVGRIPDRDLSVLCGSGAVDFGAQQLPTVRFVSVLR